MRAEDVPLPTALGLILREKLTGQPVPARAAPGVAMVRQWIEDRAGADFDALARSLDDQKAFQNLSLDLLRHLELTMPEDPDQSSDDSDDGDNDNDGNNDGDNDDNNDEDDLLKLERSQNYFCVCVTQKSR